MRAGVYLRISSDPSGKGAGVARQQTECESLCDARGWEVVAIYTDNDRSAYSGKRRPEYERLLSDVELGTLDAIVAWHPDRLHRSPIELERFIDVVESAKVAVATVQGGEYDLSTAAGRMTARVVGAVARHESEHKAERHRAKAAELARLGKVGGGGSRPFGFESDRITHRPDEAALIREAVDHILSGGSVRSIVRDWDNRGVPTPSGRAWSATVVRRMLRSGRIAGLREHRGEVVGPAEWAGIITPEDHYAVRATLDTRATKPGRPREYLLTAGIGRCGLCGSRLVARPRGDKSRSMVCASGPGFSGCGKIRALADPVEEYVRDRVVEDIAGARFAEAVGEFDAPDTASAFEEMRALEARLEQLNQDHYVDGILGRAEYMKARESIEGRLAAATGRLAAATGAKAVESIPTDPEALRAAWDASDIDWRRSVLSMVVESVEIGPAVRGRNYFDPERITINWR